MERLIDLIEQLKARCVDNESVIMAEADLSPAEYNGISALEPEEEVCGSTLSRKMNLSPSRASRVIDKLVRNGYFLRECDSEDRRRCTISLAEKGILVKRRIEEIKRECEDRVIQGLSTKERKYFTSSLKKINRIL
ncbi:MAG: MarR family transcriptional regulator [Candidatus Aminicenantes bacterium]|nr:MarR family transcriptional regulator [Candidatus Aminicenantes bacterium]